MATKDRPKEERDADIVATWHLVVRFFMDDLAKALTWWSFPNPNLGNVSPAEMIELGREAKLLKWVRQQVVE